MPNLKLAAANSSFRYDRSISPQAERIFHSIPAKEVREAGISPRNIQDALNNIHRAIDTHTYEFEMFGE